MVCFPFYYFIYLCLCLYLRWRFYIFSQLYIASYPILYTYTYKDTHCYNLKCGGLFVHTPKKKKKKL